MKARIVRARRILRHQMKPAAEPGIRYFSSHFSVPLLLVCLVVEVGVLISLLFFEPTLMRGLVGVAVLLVWVMFYTVRVEVDCDCIYLTHGVGLIERRFDLAAVESVRVLPNRYVTSWVYAPFGSHVLMAHLRGGGKVVIPTEDPRVLSRAMNVKV